MERIYPEFPLRIPFCGWVVVDLWLITEKFQWKIQRTFIKPILTYNSNLKHCPGAQSGRKPKTQANVIVLLYQNV